MAEYKSVYTGEQIDAGITKANTALQQETDPIFSASASANITSEDIANWDNKSEFSGDYDDLTNKPELFSGNYNDLTNKPTIPDELSDLSDDSTHRLVTDTEKSTWNNKSDFSGSYNDLTNKPDIPSTTSDLTNDSGFITKSVDDLVNYYLKSETYTKDEVTALIGAIQQFHYEIVQELPQTGETNIMYLVPKSTSQTNNYYDEYVYSNGWEKIGDTEIDLSNYVTVTMLNTALSFYTNTVDLTTLLAGKQDVIDSSHKLDADLVDDTNSTNKFTTASDITKLAGIESGANVNVQADWNESDTTSDSYILNKPSIPIIPSDLKVFYIEENDAQHPFVFSEHELGIYIFSNGLKNYNNFYMKLNNDETSYKMISTPKTFVLKYIKDVSTLTVNYTPFAYLNGTTYETSNNAYNMQLCDMELKYSVNSSPVHIETSSISGDFYTTYNLNVLNKPQTITAKKTFSVLPESSVTPTTNNQLTNKAYVDSKSSQVETMPTASAETVGKIVQYTGATDSTYTNGYFYVGTTDGEATPTYSWENINVQASDGGSYLPTSNGWNIGDTTSVNGHNLYVDLQAILDEWRNNYGSNGTKVPSFATDGYLLSNIYASSYSSTNDYRTYIFYFTRVNNATYYYVQITAYFHYSTYEIYDETSTRKASISSVSSGTYLTSHQSLSNYLAKNNTDLYTPTGEYNPATKKYVDTTFAQIDLTQYLAKNNSEQYTPLSAYNPATKLYVENYADSLFNAVNQLSFVVVSSLPTQDISTTKIYLVGSSSPYNMYVYINNNWELIGTTQVDFEPEVINNSNTTYTISTLYGNKSYKLGEIEELTISATTTFEKETVIYFTSGTTPTEISLPVTITNLGDAPEFTLNNNMNEGTCIENKNYIVSILNNIAYWKGY